MDAGVPSAATHPNAEVADDHVPPSNRRRLAPQALPAPSLLLAVVLAAALAGCGLAGGSPSPTPADVTITLQVLVRDGAIRAPGAECAGARPFLYVHAGGPYRIEDPADESVLVTGTLPAGEAVKAVQEDLGVPREPTFCVFSLPVGLPELDGYQVVLEEGPPKPFGPSDIDDQGRVTVAIP